MLGKNITSITSPNPKLATATNTNNNNLFSLLKPANCTSTPAQNTVRTGRNIRVSNGDQVTSKDSKILTFATVNKP